MPRFVVSEETRGVKLVVDKFEVPFTLIKDTELDQVLCLVAGGAKKVQFVLEHLNTTGEQ